MWDFLFLRSSTWIHGSSYSGADVKLWGDFSMTSKECFLQIYIAGFQWFIFSQTRSDAPPFTLGPTDFHDPDASGGAPSAAAALPGGAASEDIATTDTIPVAGCNSSWWAGVKKHVCVYV